ncbi:chemotaxis-specific protein-glutamate methyltransferase CheB [Alienimonas chondri]|uniref:chemotaxis-specific protein-glutamate methyltransferase CheB n=1 Tax=Alienimonas chondri TaxID=2681879 RepID=UPI0028F45936|nr:chemotaxis-specific protein-glutamate methyltransferase CheB [Alienimonas chondri]
MLIIDDSQVALDLLTAILEHESDIEVVGTARDGVEGVELVERLRPDVVSMDVQMPRMDGFAATRAIMSTHPTPIVIVSGSMESPNVEKSILSLRAGALAVIGKPGAPTSPRFDRSRRTLVDTLRTMADVKVVRIRPAPLRPAAPPKVDVDHRIPGVIAIAASTGGPVALDQLLSALPDDFPAPILLVQHISTGFLDGFVAWLNDTIALKAVTAEHGQRIRPGVVYVGPEGRHLCLGSKGRLTLTDDPPLGGFRPAASALFESTGRVYGAEGVACIMSGMGCDGVDGLRAVRQAGGLVLAQSKETCVVYGMPRAAAEAGLVDHSESPQRMAARLLKLTNVNP